MFGVTSLRGSACLNTYGRVAGLGKLIKGSQCEPHSGTDQLVKYQIAEFANSIDLDEMAHNEPPQLDLHCLPSSLLNSQTRIAWT